MKKYLWTVVGGLVGGAVGFVYYSFVGCRSGSCSLMSDPYISSFLGILVGATLFLPSKSKREGSSDDNQRNDN
jgi:xanthosine utilization system XapX-like protein